MKYSFLNIHDVILILTIFESLFLGILLKTIPSQHQQPRNILAFFFVLIAGMLVGTLITWNEYLQTQPIGHSFLIPILLSCSILLQGPSLYLYFLALSEPNKVWRWVNLLHLLPAALVTVIIVVAGIDLVDWLPWTPQLPHRQSVIELVLFIFKCVPFIYMLVCVYAERTLRQRLKNVYSNISERELHLADAVLYGILLQSSWTLVAYFLGAHISGYMNDLLGVLNNYLTVILINLLFVFGIFNTREKIYEAQPQQEKNVEVAKLAEKIAAIEKGLHENKLYLDSQINLERFAERVQVKPRDLSTIINSHYQSNFFEFINGYRIEEVKKLLASPEFQDKTILEIVYQSGFNSQSAFHRFFKRIVGMSPSSYRQLMNQSQSTLNNL